MTAGTNGKCAQWKMLQPRRNALAVILVTVSAVASTAAPARADDRVRIEGTFPVLYAYPSTINYCADGPGDDRVSVQATGVGTVPGLGALFLTVKKCYRFSDGTYAGSFTLSAANGDALYGIYDGTQGPLDGNGFGPFQGVLTIKGGTGRFRNARGQLRFEAIGGPDSVSAFAADRYNGMAFYAIRGTLVSSGDH